PKTKRRIVNGIRYLLFLIILPPSLHSCFPQRYLERERRVAGACADSNAELTAVRVRQRSGPGAFSVHDLFAGDHLALNVIYNVDTKHDPRVRRNQAHSQLLAWFAIEGIKRWRIAPYPAFQNDLFAI